MIQNFSLVHDVSITKIKSYIYQKIERENWWNLEDFISNLTMFLKNEDVGEIVKEMLKGILASFPF